MSVSLVEAYPPDERGWGKATGPLSVGDGGTNWSGLFPVVFFVRHGKTEKWKVKNRNEDDDCHNKMTETKTKSSITHKRNVNFFWPLL